MRAAGRTSTKHQFSAQTQRLWGRRQAMFLLRVVLCSLAVAAQAQSATEYQVKAAFLFNFARFVEWPADAFPSPDTPLQICVFGPDPFGRDFEQLIVDKTVNGRRIEIAHPEGALQARACQILFVSTPEKQQREILQELNGASVLTVGDNPGFVNLGGVIGFVLDDGRVRFEANLKAAERARLKLGARLLTVAKTVLASDRGER